MNKKLANDCDNEEFVTVENASKLLCVSQKTIHRLIADGNLRVIKVRRCLRIRKSSLAKFIEASDATSPLAYTGGK